MGPVGFEPTTKRLWEVRYNVKYVFYFQLCLKNNIFCRFRAHSVQHLQCAMLCKGYSRYTLLIRILLRWIVNYSSICSEFTINNPISPSGTVRLIAGLNPVGTAKNDTKELTKKSILFVFLATFPLKTASYHSYAWRVPLLSVFPRTRDCGIDFAS